MSKYIEEKYKFVYLNVNDIIKDEISKYYNNFNKLEKVKLV